MPGAKKPGPDRKVDTIKLLEEGLFELGLGGDDKTFSLLNYYIDEIELFNPAYGLVKAASRQELIVKHILDSLAPIKILEDLLAKESPAGAGLQGKPVIWRIADIGSGAGLPGIPLAICMSDIEFTLIERMGRRAGFLRNVLAVLGLPNVRVEESDVEELSLKPLWAGRFKLIVFRAFSPLENKMLKDLMTLLAPGGLIAAYKGRRETIEKEMALCKKAGDTSWDIIPLKSPFLNEERHLLVIEAAG